MQALSRVFRQKQTPQERSPADEHYIGGRFRPVHFIASLAENSADQYYDNAECEHSSNQCIGPPFPKQHATDQIKYIMDAMPQQPYRAAFFSCLPLFPLIYYACAAGGPASSLTTIREAQIIIRDHGKDKYGEQLFFPHSLEGKRTGALVWKIP
jgi:hypothetical protein